MAWQAPVGKGFQQPSNIKPFAFEEAPGATRAGAAHAADLDFVAVAFSGAGTAPRTEKMAEDITTRTKNFAFRFNGNLLFCIGC
jgi:hypothetical protein